MPPRRAVAVLLAIALPAAGVGLAVRASGPGSGGGAEVAADVSPRGPAPTPAPAPLPDRPVTTAERPPRSEWVRVPDGSRPRAVAGRVAVVGDSLTVGSQAALEVAAERLGFTLAVSAEEGRRIPEAIDDLSRLAQTADLVVMALGTNDAADRGFDPADGPRLVAMALATVPKAVPVLWVDVWRDPDGDAAADAAAFNRALAAAARTGRLEVLRWSGRVGAEPELVGSDGVHLTDDGYVVRAAFIADAVARRLPTAVTPPASAG